MTLKKYPKSTDSYFVTCFFDKDLKLRILFGKRDDGEDSLV